MPTGDSTTTPNTRGASRKSKSKESFSQDLVEQIKSNLSIGQLAGTSKSRSSCLFCGSDDDDLQLYHNNDTWFCFRCNKGGDVFDWLKAEDGGLTWSQLVRKAASIAGIPVKPPKERIEILSRVMAVYRDNLEYSAAARAWLEARGIEPETWFATNIGYAMDIPPGVTMGDLKRVRLVNGEPPFAHFEQRLVFAIHTRDSEIIHLQGRSLDGSEPKYKQLPKNTDDGSFPISHYLYGEEQLKRRTSDAFLLEGIPDTLIVRQYGLTGYGVLGNQGFAHHGYKLAGHKRLWVVMDNDDASQSKVFKELIDLQARMPETDVRYVLLPKANDEKKIDVNDWYLAHGKPSVDTFWEVIHQHSKPVVEALIDHWGADLRRHDSLVDLINRQPDHERWMHRLGAVSGEPMIALHYLSRIREQLRYG